jgi:vancomycin permeability regulator SanA
LKRKILIGIALLLAAPVVGLFALLWSGLTDHLGLADVALVLGNTVNPDGTPSTRLKARLDKTAELYKAGYFPKVIVSGATGKEGVPEGTAMKKYLVQAGIPASAIIVDDQGVDTFASAENTARILKAENLKSVLVVTQYFHIPRSKLALSKFGITPIYNAHPAYFEGRDFYSTLREVPAYLKYLLRPASSVQG